MRKEGMMTVVAVMVLMILGMALGVIVGLGIGWLVWT
jgi:hypothetical protein